MKILMICDFYNENQQYQENLLAKYYIKYGHNVTIVASTFSSIFDYYSMKYNKYSLGHEKNINGYKLIKQPYSINFLNKIRLLKNLKQILNQETPDLIFVHGMPLCLKASINYKSTNPNCKVIFDSHADFSNSARNWLSLIFLHKIFFRTILKLCLKSVDKVFFITPDGGNFLNKVYGIPYNSMNMLPLGADTDYINEIKNHNVPKKIRENLGIKPSDFAIFSGGKLNRGKKIDLVINSFHLLKSNSVHLLIVGDTEDKILKQEIIELINHHPRIHLIGWVEGNKVYDYMSACDIAVFPASQSVLWQQAIGTGLPLIIGQLENQDATYLNKNDNILIIENKLVSKERISFLLQNIIDDSSHLSTMKVNASKTANEFLSYDNISLLSINFK